MSLIYMKNMQIKAFSLIEVLIFVVVFSLFFIIAATVVVSTLRITTTNQNKIKATHFNDELGEWLRSEKEVNWGGAVYVEGSGDADSFTEQSTLQYSTNPNNNTSFCFDTALTQSWPSSGTTLCDFSLESKFRRMATFSADLTADNYVTQITAIITTEWKEGNSVRSSSIQKVFSIWE